MRPIIIPFDPNKYGQVWVYANVLAGDRKSLKMIEFKLDSGSDLTTLSCDDLSKLGYTDEFLRSCPFHKSGAVGASDEIKLTLQYITNVSIKFEDRELQGCRVYFSLGTSLRSLLGSDILKYFNREINYDTGELRLTQTSRKTQLSEGEVPIQIYTLEQD
jgi:hypothetical protein